MPLPLSGVTCTWRSCPSCSTPSVTVLPAERPMMSPNESNEARGLPFTDTMVSPALSPACCAGVWATPFQWSSEVTATLLDGTPNENTTISARTKAMRKCMAEPAEPTMIRFQNGCWR